MSILYCHISLFNDIKTFKEMQYEAYWLEFFIITIKTSVEFIVSISDKIAHKNRFQ